jgi:methyl-accepting chemotaxis protein
LIVRQEISSASNIPSIVMVRFADKKVIAETRGTIMIKTLRAQIYTLTFAPLLVIAIASILMTMNAITTFGETATETTENAVLETERNRLKSLMDTAESIIQPYLAMPGDTGKEEAMSLLKRFIYDGSQGYIFAYNYEGVRELLGQSDAGLGNNYWDLQDQNGQYLIRDLVGMTKGNKHGYYTYYFPKPNEDEASPKYAYSIGIDKWNIFIGTGLYFDSIDAALSEINGSLVTAQSKSTVRSLIISLLIFLVAAVVTTFAIRKILGGLDNLSTSVESLANGQGDLTVILPPRGIRELDKISGNFNHFISSLASDISVLKDSSSQLSSMSSDASVKQQSLSYAVDQQRENTLQVAAAVEEMSATSSEIASNAENTSVIAASVNSEINQVLDQVNNSSRRIEELSGVLTSVDSSVQELGTNVDAISSVLDVIQSISEQTNLLALNAAIEAARAGEQGRGFAVVADEVRSLAQRSQQSTVEISDILEKLKSSSARTVNDMGTTVESRNAVNKAMEAIKGLVESTTASIGRLSDMNTMVATAATEQSTVAGDVTESINQIASSAEQIGEGSVETQHQFGRVNELALQVDSVSKKFTV